MTFYCLRNILASKQTDLLIRSSGLPSIDLGLSGTLRVPPDIVLHDGKPVLWSMTSVKLVLTDHRDDTRRIVRIPSDHLPFIASLICKQNYMAELSHCFFFLPHSEGMGKVLFSQVSVCSHFGGLGGLPPSSWWGRVSHPANRGGTPIWQMGGYPHPVPTWVPGGGVSPSSQWGYPIWPTGDTSH